MSIAASKPTSLDEYRAQAQELQGTLDHLVVETRAAAVKGQMAQWSRLRQRQSEVAKKLASTHASIAQLEFSARMMPPRTFSNRVQR